MEIRKCFIMIGRNQIPYVHSNSLIFFSLVPCKMQIHYSINFYSFKIWHYIIKDATRAKKKPVHEKIYC